jgi:hypothetical protein
VPGLPAPSCAAREYSYERRRPESTTLHQVVRGVAGGHSGSITVIQRLQSDLRLNPHCHAILLDGVFAPTRNGALDFHLLPSLSTAELAELLQGVRVRVLGWLCRRGVIEDSSQLAVAR